MAETGELIVRFKKGVSEDDARAAITKTGASVRRRMRYDTDDEVMLLVRQGSEKLKDLESKLKANASVTFLELNRGDFKALD